MAPALTGACRREWSVWCRRRPRAGHAAGCVPQWLVPDAAAQEGPRVVVTGPAWGDPARWVARVALAAAQLPPFRSALRLSVSRRDGALRGPSSPARLDHTAVRRCVHGAAPVGVDTQRGDVPRRRAGGWPVRRTRRAVVRRRVDVQ